MSPSSSVYGIGGGLGASDNKVSHASPLHVVVRCVVLVELPCHPSSFDGFKPSLLVHQGFGDEGPFVTETLFVLGQKSAFAQLELFLHFQISFGHHVSVMVVILISV